MPSCGSRICCSQITQFLSFFLSQKEHVHMQQSQEVEGCRGKGGRLEPGSWSLPELPVKSHSQRTLPRWGELCAVLHRISCPHPLFLLGQMHPGLSDPHLQTAGLCLAAFAALKLAMMPAAVSACPHMGFWVRGLCVSSLGDVAAHCPQGLGAVTPP